MSRIRTVKPEWLEDEKLAACSNEARLLSLGLILLSDDYGRGRASHGYLASQVWMYHPRETLAKVSEALDELTKINFVIIYDVGGEQFYQIRNWRKHQKVDHPGTSRIPGPDGAPSRESRESLAKASENLAFHTKDLGPRIIKAKPSPKGLPKQEQERGQEIGTAFSPKREEVVASTNGNGQTLSWLAEPAALWQGAYGGAFPFKKAAGLLKPVITAVGVDEMVRRLRRYTATTPAQYSSLSKFAETHGSYAGTVDPRQPPPVRPAPAPDDQPRVNGVVQDLRKMEAEIARDRDAAATEGVVR